MLRALLLFLVFAAAPAWAQGYSSKELDEAAQNWRRELIDSIPAEQKQPDLIAALSATAAADFAAGRYAPAVEELQRVIANGGESAEIWLRLAESQLAAQDDHAMASAYNAYRRAGDAAGRAAALFVIGRDYDRHDRQKEALAAFEAGLALTPDPAVAARAAQLRRLLAFRVTRVEVAAEAEEGRACLRFNRLIAPRNDLSTFVRSEPALDGIVTARGDTMCLDGLKHGGVYRVEILAGLPATTGEKLPDTVTARVVVPDRKPSVRFAGTGYVLPREGTPGLPVTTINVARLRLKLLRVNERNLVPTLDSDRLTLSFSADDVDQIVNDTGSLVWQGEMAITGPRNRPVATAIPLKDMLRDNGPGIYLAVARRADLKEGEVGQPATNWVLVSDLGLAAYKGADGLAVDVRSLHDATPLAGVTVRLYARNNGELASATSDADGIAHLPGGLLRGRGGDEPFAITAYGPGGDFNFLEIGRAAFDLSDRGVSGRAPPGPVDAFLYTDRGIYRPGETVHLMALLRDDKALALGDLPVTMKTESP